MHCGCMPYLTCSPYCCNDGAYCGLGGEQCKYGCCGANCDCLVNERLDWYCGQETNSCSCVSLNDVCYYASTSGCAGADHWLSGAECGSGTCNICGYQPVASYYTSNNTCSFGCNFECKTGVGWEEQGCSSSCSLGGCCQCAENGCVPGPDEFCPLQYCGGKPEDPCACQGCNLNQLGSQILDFNCELSGTHRLSEGDLTIANGGSITMLANSIFQFDNGKKIIMQENAYIIMSNFNVKIEKVY